MAADKTSIKGLVYAALFGALTATGAFISYSPATGADHRADIFFKCLGCASRRPVGSIESIYLCHAGSCGNTGFCRRHSGLGCYLRSHRRLFTGLYYRGFCHRDDQSNEKKRGHFLEYLFHADRNVDNLFIGKPSAFFGG